MIFNGLIILYSNIDKNGELANINKTPAEIQDCRKAREIFVRKELQLAFYKLNGCV